MTLTFLSPSVICTPGSSVSTGVLESWDRLSTPNPILKSQFWHTLSDVHMYIIDYDANPCCGRYNAVIFNAEPFLLTKLLHRIQLAIFPCHDQVNNCPVADQRSMNTSPPVYNNGSFLLSNLHTKADFVEECFPLLLLILLLLLLLLQLLPTNYH